MKPLYHHQYIAKLYLQRDQQALFELDRILFAAGANSQVPNYGLPEPLFLFTEGRSWFGAATKATSSSYFARTPPDRRQCMLAALKAHAPPHFADTYALGIHDYGDGDGEEDSKTLDQWMEQREDEFDQVLWRLLEHARPDVEAILCDP